MPMYYALGPIAAASEEVARVYAQTMQNHADSIQCLHHNQGHFGGQTSEAFAHAITVVNNAYEQAANDVQMAGRAVQMAGENAGTQDSASAAQYL